MKISMSEVNALCVEGNQQLAALREELATLHDQHAEQSCIFCNDSGELLSKVKSLSASLTAAEQRNAHLEKILDECRYNFNFNKTETMLVGIIDELLIKPTESGASDV